MGGAGVAAPDGPLAVVRIGGSGYSVLTRDAGGRIAYETNERCSAGTGETVEGLCARLGCGIDEAVALAAAADRGITVTSRCAGFAKSELTHFANQGESMAALFAACSRVWRATCTRCTTATRSTAG